jgi:Flp pilus assembly secretin CpaC
MTKRFKIILAATTLLAPLSLIDQGRADEAPPVSRQMKSVPADVDVSSINVVLDFAKVLSFGEPARTIIIGNPAVVDGTLNDESTLVLTGKAVGVTNMIVLGEAGREILNLRVQVLPNSSQVTTIYNGLTQHVYSCVDTCRPIGKPEPDKQQP